MVIKELLGDFGPWWAMVRIVPKPAQQLYPTVCVGSGPGQYLVTALAMLCLLVTSPSIYVLLQLRLYHLDL
jgi:hypothetical protein